MHSVVVQGEQVLEAIPVNADGGENDDGGDIGPGDVADETECVLRTGVTEHDRRDDGDSEERDEAEEDEELHAER